MARKTKSHLPLNVLNVATLLKKPGQGLLTVTTGSGQAERVLGPLLGLMSEREWQSQSLRRLKASGPHIVALPSDTGGGICRGAAHGPLALRAALYSKHPHWAACELGDLPCIPQILEDSMLNLKQKNACGVAIWGSRYQLSKPVAPLNLLKDFLIEAFAANPETFRPLILGGDHSISWSVFESLFESQKTPRLAVLHFDAHTDLLETRYGVDHCFATWAAHATKRLLLHKRKNFIQVGLRVSSKTQSFWEKKFGLKQYWASQVRKADPIEFANRLISSWKRNGCDSLYISFDVDALDPQFVPSTGTPEPGGLDVSWCQNVIARVSSALPLVAADIVELAPVLGSARDTHKSANNAARIARSLLEGLRVWEK
jgi:agmatinase